MKNLIKVCFVVLVVGCSNREKIVDKYDLLGKDYRLFQNTPAWNLAKAVEDEDLEKIKDEIGKNKSIIDYQEPRLGGSLLMFAIFNNQFKSFKTLLEQGADPNLKDYNRGSNSVIYAADNENPKYLALILKYHGNPNSLETAPISTESDKVRSAALNVAISDTGSQSLEKVKLLVEAGADVNYSSEGLEYFTRLPLADAITVKRIDIVFYLLNNGASYEKVIYKRIDGKSVYILEALRQCIIDLDSEQYRYKLKVINFLKLKGLDYHSQPIPGYILKSIKIKHPNDWEEYLTKY